MFILTDTSFVMRPSTTTTDAPKKKDKETNKVALFAAMGGAVLCSVLFVTVLCVCLHTKRCGCPCGSRNTAQVVEPFDSTSRREHRNVSRTGSIFTSHLSRSVGSLPNDEVLSLRILSPPPYSSGPPPSIDSPSDSSSPPPPYSFNDPHPDVVVQSDSLPSYPGEVSRYWRNNQFVTVFKVLFFFFINLRPLDAYILCQMKYNVNTLWTYCNSVQEYQCIEDILQLFNIYLFPVESF